MSCGIPIRSSTDKVEDLSSYFIDCDELYAQSRSSPQPNQQNSQQQSQPKVIASGMEPFTVVTHQMSSYSVLTNKPEIWRRKYLIHTYIQFLQKGTDMKDYKFLFEASRNILTVEACIYCEGAVDTAKVFIPELKSRAVGKK